MLYTGIMSKLDQIRKLREARAVRPRKAGAAGGGKTRTAPPLAKGSAVVGVRAGRSKTTGVAGEALLSAVEKSSEPASPVQQGRGRGRGRPKGPETVPLAVRVPPALLERLDQEIARRNGVTGWSMGERVTRSDAVRSILDKVLK